MLKGHKDQRGKKTNGVCGGWNWGANWAVGECQGERSALCSSTETVFPVGLDHTGTTITGKYASLLYLLPIHLESKTIL